MSKYIASDKVTAGDTIIHKGMAREVVNVQVDPGVRTRMVLIRVSNGSTLVYPMGAPIEMS